MPSTLIELEIGNKLSKNHFVINNLPKTLNNLTLNLDYDYDCDFADPIYNFSSELKELKINIIPNEYGDFLEKNILTFNLIKNSNELITTLIKFSINSLPSTNFPENLKFPDYINYLYIISMDEIKFNIPKNINKFIIEKYHPIDINLSEFELNKNLFVIKNKKDIIIKNYSKNNIYFIKEIKQNYFIIKYDSNLIVGFIDINIFLNKSGINKIELSSLDLIKNIKQLKNYETYFTLFCSNNDDFDYKFEKIDNLIINFDRNFNKKIDNLPINTKKINFNGDIWDDDWYPNEFNQSFNNLPNKITHIEIKLNMFFNQSLDYLPSSIKYLHIESNTLNLR